MRCSDSCEACAGGEGGEETVRRKKRVSAVKVHINEDILLNDIPIFQMQEK